jgi:hypothetical protein
MAEFMDKDQETEDNTHGQSIDEKFHRKDK